jgi:hypothetical protein
MRLQVNPMLRTDEVGEQVRKEGGKPHGRKTSKE